jgi:uncharacterized protein YndB with AHSA1/START domain
VDQSSSVRTFAPDETLEFSRTFDAPRDLVWRMWRDPEHMVRWHGPEGFWLTSCEIDFRVGGKWRRCMSHAEDHAHWIHGEYLEIREPERLRFTYINEYDPFETVVTLDFEDVGGKTLMRFHQAPFPTEEEHTSHGWGWNSAMQLLADYLVQVVANDGKPAGHPRIDGVAADIIAIRERQQQERTR